MAPAPDLTALFEEAMALYAAGRTSTVRERLEQLTRALGPLGWRSASVAFR